MQLRRSWAKLERADCRAEKIAPPQAPPTDQNSHHCPAAADQKRLNQKLIEDIFAWSANCFPNSYSRVRSFTVTSMMF